MMNWSIDVKLTSLGRDELLRITEGEILGRGYQPQLVDPTISRMCARIAVDDQGMPMLESLGGLFQGGAAEQDVAVEVGQQFSLQPSGPMMTITRVEREAVHLVAQRLGECPIPLLGPAWSVDVGAEPWLIPRSSAEEVAIGIVKDDGSDVWYWKQGRSLQLIAPASSFQVVYTTIYFVQPRRTAPAAPTLMSTGVTITHDKKTETITVRSGPLEETFVGTHYFALRALLSAEQMTPTQDLVKAAQGGWKSHNLNVAVSQIRSTLANIGVDFDRYYVARRNHRCLRRMGLNVVEV